jgi:enoyl-[acyl-carrier-protein] reductase (NADH)
VLAEARDELEAKSEGGRVRLLTRGEFVDEILYGSGRDVGAQIVGFNIPFDISRLAIHHDSARRSMRGGFTFKLSEKERRANVAVKHLSQKAALIRFTGEKPEKAEDEAEETDPDAAHESELPADPDRGYFVDVKTLAAALTNSSHSLASLSELLNVRTKKIDSEEHGGPLTPEYVRYGLRDVQTTWECFDALAQRFASFGLDQTGAYDLYSEASLGKAYLKTMKIARWRDLQPKFAASRELAFHRSALVALSFGGSRNAVRPVNAILSYAYAALESETRIKAISDGYDPTIGIMHEGSDGSSKFIFDLMEPKRPNIAWYWNLFEDTFSTRPTLSFAATAFVGLIRRWRGWSGRKFRSRKSSIRASALINAAASASPPRSCPTPRRSRSAKPVGPRRARNRSLGPNGLDETARQGHRPE